MKHFGRIFIVAATAIFLTLSLALAGSKFENKDTAKDRRENVFGTDEAPDTATVTTGANDAGDSTLKVKPKPKEPEVDWYDKVIITVNPETSWPQESTTTTTTTTTDSLTGGTTTTESTETVK